MKYQLTSVTKSETEAVKLEFKQVPDEIAVEFPLTVTIEGFFKDSGFVDTMVLLEFFEIEFSERNIYSINGRLLVDILDFRQKFDIRLDFQQREDPYDYGPVADNDDPENILDSEIIE